MADQTITDRDLPQEEPRDCELKEIAADLWAQLKKERDLYGISALGDKLAEARIRMALLEVRHAATLNATNKAYAKAQEIIGADRCSACRVGPRCDEGV